jgi:4'-phosphopantetheinyl transferase
MAMQAGHTIAMDEAMPCIDASGVLAWHAPTTVVDDEVARARALGWLTDVERARFDRFRHDIDRRMFLLGRVMARAAVGRALGVAPAAWPWREGPRGRPEIAIDATDLRFNIAHSAGLVVCGLARGREVGVDVENLDRPATDLEIVHRYCAPEEVRDILAAGADGWRARFLRYWTLKEAYLKARGLGIAVPLAEIQFSRTDPACVAFLDTLAGTDTRWTFHLEQVTPRHLIAVAAHAPGAAPDIRIAPFPAAWLP